MPVHKPAYQTVYCPASLWLSLTGNLQDNFLEVTREKGIPNPSPVGEGFGIQVGLGPHQQAWEHFFDLCLLVANLDLRAKLIRGAIFKPVKRPLGTPGLWGLAIFSLLSLNLYKECRDTVTLFPRNYPFIIIGIISFRLWRKYQLNPRL